MLSAAEKKFWEAVAVWPNSHNAAHQLYNALSTMNYDPQNGNKAAQGAWIEALTLVERHHLNIVFKEAAIGRGSQESLFNVAKRINNSATSDPRCDRSIILAHLQPPAIV